MLTAKKQQNSKSVWLIALLLFVSVAATTMCVVEHFQTYAMDDEGALPLVPSIAIEESAVEAESGAEDETEGAAPGFEISDDNKVWTRTTDIDIFSASYENGAYQVTVQSGDGDSLIAPGTDNSYIFKLKNTGNVPVEYALDVDVFFQPADAAIPVEGRISRYDGSWIAGDANNFVEILNLDSIGDQGTLGAGRYTYYTLDWMWPFEQGTDEDDTALGNLAAQEDLTLTIRIKTVATASDDMDSNAGIKAPSTGDAQPILLWGALALTAVCLLVFLLYFRRKSKEDELEDREGGSRENA